MAGLPTVKPGSERGLVPSPDDDPDGLILDGRTREGRVKEAGNGCLQRCKGGAREGGRG
jgi:hypothetical protein